MLLSSQQKGDAVSPWRAKKPCAKPGCATLVTSGYCEQHRLQLPKRPSGPSIDRGWKSLYNRQWKKERKRWLRRYPNCVLCGGRATVVDHKEPHRGNRALFWNRDNWQSLCKSCHDAKTQSEINRRSGGAKETLVPSPGPRRKRPVKNSAGRGP
jgi:5-methylcytosine-specific restriction protein A